MYNPLLLLFVFATTLVYNGFFLMLAYWVVFKPVQYYLRKKELMKLSAGKKTWSLVIVLLLLFTVYQTYVSFYPTESYYIEEFEVHAGVEWPESAEIINKSSTYPDFYGSYSARAAFTLTVEEYDSLLAVFTADSCYTKSSDVYEYRQTFLRQLSKTDSLVVVFNTDGQSVSFVHSRN